MKKVLKISVGLLSALLLGCYGAGCYYFQSHYYYGTTIEGRLYGCMAEPETEEDLQRRQDGYTLTVHGRNHLTDVLKGDESGLIFEPGKELSEILGRQNYYLWPLSFFEGHSYELTHSVQVNEEKFSEAAGRMSVFLPENIQKPQNAYLSSYSPLDKGYFIVPEVEGNRIHKEEALAAIREALIRRESELELTGPQYYDRPLLRAEDEMLIQKAEQRNNYTKLAFTYNMHGVELVVDGDQIHEWLKEKDGRVYVDKEKVLSYVQELADTYDTYGKEREFMTVRGVQKHLRSGAYGWKMDVEEEYQAMLAMLEEGKSCSREPQWKKKGYVEGTLDIGDTYVEIDLGAQRLYLVKDKEVILESKFVSGNAARGWGTPSGVFGLTYKTRNAVLRGENYETPVNYWMPFNHNIGMNDATWRGSFGGDIYKTNGSHGCINLPFGNAEKIYNFVETNMPVVCYY